MLCRSQVLRVKQGQHLVEHGVMDAVERESRAAVALQHAGFGEGLFGPVSAKADQQLVHTASPSRSMLRCRNMPAASSESQNALS